MRKIVFRHFRRDRKTELAEYLLGAILSSTSQVPNLGPGVHRSIQNERHITIPYILQKERPRECSTGMNRFCASDRLEYLQGLVTEFQDTDSEEAKEQILANLANFAYDPRSMEALRMLQVTELFLDMLTEENENFVEFGIGGLCNLSMDRECRDQILQSGGIPLVTGCLSSHRDETVLSAITTLMNLTTAASRSQTTDGAVVQSMLRFSLTQNPRLSNLATVFLQDYCTQDQVDKARELLQGHSQSAVGIPLPKD
ncbi:hypothetical protein AMELA_G00112190 [Ameiurus melas]|uniref:Armadillo repeat-containing protein 7 n=1 Tax=Ameiurus melas TaxID=219545 RepID=A0A7J6AQ01_AMEME|nr:hypothetical protein AMELA_G00112190 [Ameiurus melas]